MEYHRATACDLLVLVFNSVVLSNMSKDTLPETNSSHLEMDGWNTSFLLGWPIFRGELLVSGSVQSFADQIRILGDFHHQVIGFEVNIVCLSGGK